VIARPFGGLRDFVAAGRMKLPGSTYTPCYRIVA
jgi:hypothetical protein